MLYFKDCKTKDEAKELFRKLAKKLHPDYGGDENQMKSLLKQYESFEEIKNHSNSNPEQEQTWNKSNWSDQFEWAKEFKKTQDMRKEKVDISQLVKENKRLEVENYDRSRRIRNLEDSLSQERDRYQLLFEEYEENHEELKNRRLFKESYENIKSDLIDTITILEGKIRVKNVLLKMTIFFLILWSILKLGLGCI